MLIGIWNRYVVLNATMLTNIEAPIGDGLLAPIVDLAAEARRRGHTLQPLDAIVDADVEPDAVLFLDRPFPNDFIGATIFRDAKTPLYLLAFEPPVVAPENYRDLAPFRRVFTWSTGLAAAGEPFVHFDYALRIPPPIGNTPRERLACMIAGNKASMAQAALYSKRYDDARWFDGNVPWDLALYGPGWELDPNVRLVYHGRIERKAPVLQRHVFSLCYENMQAPGYVTEKLLDCLVNGCIPVYLGDPDVRQWLPSACFLDRRDYSGPAAVWKAMKEMPLAEIERRQAEIAAFVRSDYFVNRFSTATFAADILDTIEGAR